MQAAEVVQVQHLQPVRVVEEHVSQAGVGPERQDSLGGVLGGELQHHPVLEEDDIEGPEQPRGGGHGPAEVAVARPAPIDLYRVEVCADEELGDLGLALLLEDALGLVDGQDLAADGDVLAHHLAHRRVELVDVGLGHVPVLELPVVPLPDGVPQDRLAAQGLLAGDDQKEVQAPPVNFKPVGGG